jgi:anti-sigma B factor antagonist
MTFSTANEGGRLTFRIEGELDALSVPEIRTELERIVAARPPEVVFDLSGLRMIDSSGVGVIVSLYKRVRAYGGLVTIDGLRDQPLAILRLLGLDRILAA